MTAGRHGGRHGRGGPFGRHRGGPFGGRGPRMFDPGALRLVVLGLIAEEPRSGYDIIKALEAKFQGAYSPSPGAIYPMLQMLEEADLVASQAEGNKRLFSITEQGRAYLAEQAGRAREDQCADRRIVGRGRQRSVGRRSPRAGQGSVQPAARRLADCRASRKGARNPEEGAARPGRPVASQVRPGRFRPGCAGARGALRWSRPCWPPPACCASGRCARRSSRRSGASVFLCASSACASRRGARTSCRSSRR